MSDQEAETDKVQRLPRDFAQRCDCRLLDQAEGCSDGLDLAIICP